MGISMLGGIIQSILSGITSVIMAIVQPILELILGFVNRFIIGPIISLIFNLISYALSCFFYGIACFILALIDYVEMMFRLLAGLDVNGVSLNLSNSPDKGADLVVQLIRTPEVRDIFLSMVVVGMFLLIITTIFQMIKVEYTTEGAKNAKGPILMKAFKGLANMILLPALCVFGVVLGNQVLDLLDKATKPDSTNNIFGNNASAKISGTLFVAAAAEAHYQKSDFRVVFISPEPSTMPAEVIMNIVPILINSIFDAWGEAFNVDDQKNYLLSDAQRKEAESLVANGTISYWNIAGISQIYDYSKINYLLLIFGGCIVIKTLYYTCFGMIVRLYQCGMLFIISPAVIGMTPVNESGLGKWRSEFVGQAISAYGVVLALNIFFVLVRVLLSIDFSFEGVTGYFFGASLMEGLLKAIIVMGGAISIEKFSKEIGGYFGAKDALSQGKEMEKAVGDVAKKAISTAISVAMMATGVGGAAVGAAKGIGGAMKAGKAVAQAAGKKGGGLKGAMNYIGDAIGDKGSSAMQYVADMTGADVDIRGSWMQRRANKASAMEDKALSDAIALRDSGTGKEEEAVSAAKKKVSLEQEALNNMIANRKAGEFVSDADIARQEARVRGAERDQKRAESDLSFKQDAIANAEKNIGIIGDYTASRAYSDKDKQAREVEHQSQRIMRRETGRQAAKAMFEEHTFVGQALAGVKKTVGGYEKAASEEGGKEVKAAYDHLAKIKSDKKEDAANARNQTAITKKNIVQMAEMKKLVIDEVKVSNSKLELSAQSTLNNMSTWERQRQEAADSGDTLRASALAQQIQQAGDALRDKLGLGAGQIERHVDPKTKEVTYTIAADANFTLDPKIFEGMLEHIKKNGGMENEAAIKEAVKLAITGMEADQAKMIQEVFERVVAKYKK